MRLLSCAIALVLLMGCAASGDDGHNAREARNMRTAVTLYEAAINEKDFDRASQYLSEDYIQHSPTAANGREGLRAAIAYLSANFPAMHAEIKHVYADGDFVILHVFTTFQPGDRGSAIIDVVRFTPEGQVAEHWDVVQPIPEHLANENGVF